MDVFGWIVLICVFTSAFGLKCPSGFYLEPRKGCNSCTDICVNNPYRKDDCSFYCPGFSSEPAQDVPMEDVPDGRPPDDSPDTADTPDASSVNWPTILVPIACIFVLVSVVVGGTMIYRIKRRQGSLNLNQGNNAIPLMDMAQNENPEVIVQSDAEQAVITPQGIPNPEHEENSDDAASTSQGSEASDPETRNTGSRLSLCPLTEEASQDMNLDAFCSGESNVGLAQMIMNKMPDADLGKLVTPDSRHIDGGSTTVPKYVSTPTPDVDLPLEEFKGTGKGASKEPEAPNQAKDSAGAPKLPRVRLEREGGGRRYRFFVKSTSQESPDQMLSDATAIGQPTSREDPTAKYYLGEPANAQPYLTQCFNDIQQPAAEGLVPDGVNTFYHDDVNARYGGSMRAPVHGPNNERRPSQDEPPHL